MSFHYQGINVLEPWFSNTHVQKKRSKPAVNDSTPGDLHGCLRRGAMPLQKGMSCESDEEPTVVVIVLSSLCLCAI